MLHGYISRKIILNLFRSHLFLLNKKQILFNFFAAFLIFLKYFTTFITFKKIFLSSKACRALSILMCHYYDRLLLKLQFSSLSTMKTKILFCINLNRILCLVCHCCSRVNTVSHIRDFSDQNFKVTGFYKSY